MRVYEIDKQTIEVYGFEEDEFEKFLEKFNIDFKSRPYRPLTWFDKADFMSVEKFKKLSQSELKSTTIEYSSLRELLLFFDKLNPKEVVVMMGDDTPLMIKTVKSDSGIAVANIR